MKDSTRFPYKHLGNTLKKMRSSRQQSLAEVSGAVEIDVNMLSDIEQGAHRPSEDILLLLISYFSVKEDEATKLWELAGYGQKATPITTMSNGDEAAQPPVMVMPVDARIIYTDMVHVMVNNFGVVMNFMQSGGPNSQPLAVSRIGMSKEHARSVLEVLRNTLDQSEGADLPSPDEKPNHQSKKTEQE